MSERAVSDLVFRGLWPKSADIHRPVAGEEWETRLREELGKLRPARPAPRVVPAAEASGRTPDGSATQQHP
jgi:hypothetical protein